MTFDDVRQRDMGYCMWALAQENPSGALKEFQRFLSTGVPGANQAEAASAAGPDVSPEGKTLGTSEREDLLVQLPPEAGARPPATPLWKRRTPSDPADPKRAKLEPRYQDIRQWIRWTPFEQPGNGQQGLEASHGDE